MSYPQVQLTNYFLSASQADAGKMVVVDGEEKTILQSKNHLAMMDFPVAGFAQTFDSTSFAPDSASTATSIATGKKTWSGSINVSEDFTQTYETIAEKLKAQKDYKIGVLSTVNLNHATPAAFYAHQASRSSYYDIGLELIESGFDYFAGGGLLQTTGKNEDQEDLYTLAENAGYQVVKTQAEAEALGADSGKVIVIDEHLADSSAMSYELDRGQKEWALADYVEKGIEVLDNETGGLTIGFAGTDYDTFLKNFEIQKISYAKFDSDYVSAYKENKTDFAQVMLDVTELFGLQAPAGEGSSVTQPKDSADQHPESGKDGALVMTDYEYGLLKGCLRNDHVPYR